MDPIAIIEAALTTGVAASAQPIAGQAVKDTYEGLKGLIVRRFGDIPKVQETLKEHEEDPETYKKPLQKILRDVQAEQDEEIVQAAQHLLDIAQQQIGQGKYTIQNNGDVYGQIIGDHHTITQHFGEAPKKA